MSTKVAYEFDPFELAGVEPPAKASDRRAALGDIAEYVQGEIWKYCADGRSPVSGGEWKRSLSKEYRDRKVKDGGVAFANLEMTGELMNALEVNRQGDTLEVTVADDQQPKADGHNNFSGDSDLPPRQFIPNEGKGQTFRKEIVRGIAQIAREYADQSED